MGRHLVGSSAKASLSVALLLAGCLFSACSDARHGGPRASHVSGGPQITHVRLLKGTSPRFLTFSRDGSMWVSEDGGDAIGEVDKARQVNQYPIDLTASHPGQLAAASDGVIWFVGFGFIGEVSKGGKVLGIASFGPSDADAAGSPEAITRGPDGAPWFTTTVRGQARIARRGPTGELTNVAVPAGKAGVRLPGIAAGSDHAVWFTEVPRRPAERESIGRVSVAGSYSHWTLPRRSSGLDQITQGPDGAMWFTEGSGSRIGRITTRGTLTEFRLPPGTAPVDITAGADGALWFTTKHKIGRISTSGKVRLWAITGARDLIGIAADPHGGFWMADAEADVLDRFIPPQGCCGG